MEYKIVAYQSKAYEDSLALRQTVLRTPLGLNIKNDDLSQDKNRVHFGAFFDNKLVGIVSVYLEENQAWIKQFAVLPAYQKQSVGKKLMEISESFILNQGIKTVMLCARKVSLGFYEKMGYSCVEEEFILSTIPHIKMIKVVK